MIDKETAIVSAYAHLDAAIDAMSRMDLVKGYDLAKYKIEQALEVS